MGAQIEADARAGATRTFKDLNEANEFIYSLLPVGFRPRSEHFGSLLADAGDLDALAERMAAYARARRHGR
jgi:hypothetical protein